MKNKLQIEDHVQLVQDQGILLIGPAWYKNDYILRVRKLEIAKIIRVHMPKYSEMKVTLGVKF